MDRLTELQAVLVRNTGASGAGRCASAAVPIVELVEGDMLLPETLGPALDGVDLVLLISSTNPRMAETQPGRHGPNVAVLAQARGGDPAPVPAPWTAFQAASLGRSDRRPGNGLEFRRPTLRAGRFQLYPGSARVIPVVPGFGGDTSRAGREAGHG